jgi:hypothetical protein
MKTEMKHTRIPALLVILLTVFGLPVGLFAKPSFTITGDPQAAFFAFPHKLTLLPAPALYLSLNYGPLPWMGNITNPALRPNDSYTSNYQSVQFDTPADYTGDPASVDSWAEFNGTNDLYTAALGFIGRTGSWSYMAEVSGSFNSMQLKAAGIARGYSEAAGARLYSLVPFSANTSNTQGTFTGTVALAMPLSGIPVGFKLEGEYIPPNTVAGGFSKTKDGVETANGHLTWGWATTGCSNIFGFEHRDDVIDSFFLDSYDVVSGLRLNAQGSAQLPFAEPGLRLRYSDLSGNTYAWNDATVSYQTNEAVKLEKRQGMIRGYSAFDLIKEKALTIGVLGFLEYDANRSAYQPRDTMGATTMPTSWKDESDYVLEANPYLNAVLGERSYLDFGLLLEGAYQRFDTKYARWSSALGSLVEAYQDSSPIHGWSQYWEGFSKNDQGFFATGFEAVYRLGITKEVSLTATTLSLLKLTGERKDYGSSTGDPGEYASKFVRSGYKRELWLTGSFGVNVLLGGVVSTIAVDLPLAYLLYQTTKLTDLATSAVIFDHEKANVFQVQEPVKLRATVSLLLGNPAGSTGK